MSNNSNSSLPSVSCSSGFPLALYVDLPWRTIALGGQATAVGLAGALGSVIGLRLTYPLAAGVVVLSVVVQIVIYIKSGVQRR